MARRTIILMGEPKVSEDWAAGGAITPGMLIERNGSGLMVAHATAGGAAAYDFAMERDEMGKDIDQAYASGDYVKTAHCHAGMRVNALIANGVNAAVNSKLESAGNGTLRVFTTGVIIAQALEAVNNTSGANARLRVEII